MTWRLGRLWAPQDEGDGPQRGDRCGQDGEAGISDAGRPGERRWCGAGLPALWPSVPGGEPVNWPLVARAQGRRMAVDTALVPPPLPALGC